MTYIKQPHEETIKKSQRREEILSMLIIGILVSIAMVIGWFCLIG